LHTFLPTSESFVQHHHHGGRCHGHQPLPAARAAAAQLADK